jgi:AcrR family transcriptional regulator
MQAVLESSQASQPPRHGAILGAAVKVFFQFGYRKTSMEDVAAEAKVSRQTLYLQFRDKESLFRAALEYVTEQMTASITTLADSQRRSVEQTLLAVFEVLCKDSLSSAQVNMAELIAVSRSQERSIIDRFEAEVVSIIAEVLSRSGIASRWNRHRIGARELAIHLLTVSAGAKAASQTASDYKQRMALAIRIVVKGADGKQKSRKVKSRKAK